MVPHRCGVEATFRAVTPIDIITPAGADDSKSAATITAIAVTFILLAIISAMQLMALLKRYPLVTPLFNQLTVQLVR